MTEFSGADGRWRAALHRRFAGFLTDGPATFAISRGGEMACSSGADADPSSAAFGARVDLSAKWADLPAGATAGQAGYLVRSLLPSLLADGVIAHAAVLIQEGSGFLCCGPSGAGKSTLARLAGSRAGSEELGAVRLMDGGWTVHTLPFRTARRASARLEGVYLLYHGSRDERRRLSPAAAVPAIARHLFWPVESPASAQRVFDLLAQLVDRVPVWELDFVPTPAVWNVIAAPPDAPEGRAVGPDAPHA